MDFKTFFDTVKETAQYKSDVGIMYTALGLAGEAGEAADIIKKTIRYATKDDLPLRDVGHRTGALKLELGDVMWYWCNLCHDLGFDPEEIFQMNYDKLRERYSV